MRGADIPVCGFTELSHLLSVVELVALRRVAPRPAAQRLPANRAVRASRSAAARGGVVAARDNRFGSHFCGSFDRGFAKSYLVPFKRLPTDFEAALASAVLIFPVRSSTVFCCSGVSFKLATCLRTFAASAYFVSATSLEARSIRDCALIFSDVAAVWSFA